MVKIPLVDDSQEVIAIGTERPVYEIRNQFHPDTAHDAPFGPSGQVIVRNSFATKPYALSRIKLISALGREIEASIITAGLNKKQIAGVGIGCPGSLIMKKGSFVFCLIFPAGERSI